jgi:hypothetical protein
MQLGAAINSLKSGDFSTAGSSVNQLAHDYPSDPVVLNVKGITHFLSGSIDSARECFERITGRYPKNYTAQFNLARCHIIMNGPSAGMEFLEKAAVLNPAVINRFVQDNDRYFSEKWPSLRQLLCPDYTPPQFWKRIFLPFTKNKKTQQSLWGLSFFGISPFFSLIIFILLLMLLLLRQQYRKSYQKVRRLFECKYCGRIICRRCTTGILCDACANMTQYVPEGKTVDQTRERIVMTTSHATALRNSMLNIILPGTGSLLAVQPHYPTAIPVLLLSALVYTFWFSIIRDSSFTWMLYREVTYLIIMPLVFHLFFLVRYLPESIRRLGSLFKLYFPKKGE